MKAPTEAHWERTLSRYFLANGIPLDWDGHRKRFLGVAGHTVARINPRVEAQVWAKLPERLYRYEKEGGNAIVLVTNRQYGDSVDDSFAVMRIGTFIPMMKALVESDRERWSK
jgi:hypothetical protein